MTENKCHYFGLTPLKNEDITIQRGADQSRVLATLSRGPLE
ncbi:hypothetical protein Cflav_PD4328 [Pedosphaera parvula Ellin514]|uniref:Uncharacterized protein n=1 Tax=Pedosphaera parvula (strain Ellin514) TaxID=320771 RepID=B9XFE3_PEDPL|nr:hypothetical protein Cflav_PD4328 [Pedosphaera parvula Ellin514]